MRIYEFLLYLVDKMYYIFLIFHNKKENLEKIKYDESKKLISLSPNNDAEFIDDYYDYLCNAIYEEDKYGNRRNKNIAITGGYASGKSSIIKTFLYKANLNSKTVYVSLGSYTENDQGINDNEVEKSILQQIIYSSNKNDLPLSNIKRININGLDRMKFFCSLLFSIFITISLFIIYVLLKPSNVLFDEEYIVVCIIAFILIGLLIYIGIRSININKAKLSIGDLNLELENKKLENNTEGLLNRQIDELIYFFSKVNKSIVVFEDLDRLNNCKRIFSKLKEINEIINTAIVNKDIQFIYAVNDTLFNNQEHRTKFFDILIPIIPYGSYSNTIDIFNKNLNDSDIDESIIYEISSYISNPRDIFDIINEYRILNKNIDDKTNKVQCFYLAAYKVLYPRRFELLYRNKGIISYYLSSEFISDVKKEYDEKSKNDIDNRINALNKMHKDKIKPIVEKFLYSLGRNYDDYKSLKFYDNEKMLTTFEEIENDCEKIYNLKDTIIKASNEESEEISETDIFDNKKEFFDKIDKSKVNKEIEDLNNLKILPPNYEEISQSSKIDYIKKKLEKENKYYCKKEDFNENDYFEESFNETNYFEELLIRKNIFNYLTFDIISKKHGVSITNNDFKIIDSMYKRENLDFETKINNPNLVLKKLIADNFIYDSYCNFDLFKAILTSNNKDEYLKVFCTYLSERKLIFLAEYEMRYKGLFNNISKYYDNIWSAIASCNLEDKYVYNYLIYTLKYNKENIFPEHFKNCLTVYDNVLNYLEVYFDKVKDSLDKLNVKFRSGIEYNTDNIRTLEYIYKTNKFEPSLDVYSKLSVVNDFYFDKNSLIDTFIVNEENVYLKSNMDVLVNEALKLNIRQTNKDENIIKFINSDMYDNTTKYNLITLEKDDIKDITNINSEHYEQLMIYDKIEKNWKNLYAMRQINKNLTGAQVYYLLENLDEFSKDKTPFSNYNGLCYSLCIHNELNIKDYEKLVKLTHERNRTFSDILNVDNDKLNLLINYHLLKLNKLDDVRTLLDNKEISNKRLLIEDNYGKIKTINDFFKTSEELLMLLDSDIIIEDKINYCLNYIDSGLINDDVSGRIFDKLILTNFKIDNSEFVTGTLLALNKPEEEKIRLFLNHRYNEDISYTQALQNIGGRFVGILVQDKKIFIPKSDINKELLDFLVEIKLIKDYLPYRKNYWHII